MKPTVFVLALALAGCGGAAKTVAPASSTVPSAVAPDPTQDAQCTLEPNRPPLCYQGSYQVSITLGASCYDPAYAQPETWQQTYTDSPTVRCETVTH